MTLEEIDSVGPTAVSVIQQQEQQQNASTATESSTSETEDMDHPRRRHKRRRRIEKGRPSFFANYEIVGVVRIILSASTQNAVKCTVGEQVTAENPWTQISRDSIEYHIEVHEDTSEFNKYKEEILAYPKDDLLIGYIPDEAREYDEFYLCLTVDALEDVMITNAKVLERQQERLNNTILKKIGRWNDLGSGVEVDEAMYNPARSLIEVEVEAKYPIISSKIQFRLRLAENTEDGYAEFRSDKSVMNYITQKRIDCAIQVAPARVDKVAQTICTFPKNTWTQYHYEFDPVLHFTEEFDTNFKEFEEAVLPNICDIITVNNRFNLFTDDYNDVVTNEGTKKSAEGIQLLEFNSFTDIKYCKYKMISSVSWHPLITGILAVCYKMTAPNAYTTFKPDLDLVNYQVHGIHIVLVWSFRDALQAKLYLEAPRDVNIVSWCPFNENILIGGLWNGQVCVWDITNLIDRVEQEEILTYAQQKYRVLMYSYMEWFKNTKDIQRIRCTAISNLLFSHEGPVTSISWMHPDCKITRTGQIIRLAEDDARSMQFSTTSVDGTCLYWDLNEKITLQPGDYRPQKSRRLKKRPSALTVDVSPLRILNRMFQPVFIVNMNLPTSGNLHLSCYNRWMPNINYIPINPVQPRSKQRMDDRIFHHPVAIADDTDCVQEFFAGTLDGYFFKGRWDGFEVDSGQIINKENCQIVYIGRYHDGPIVSISRNNFLPHILLTVGGKVFSIWSTHLPEKPILWRRSRHRYTHGAWNVARRNLFHLCRSDGNKETWSILERSDEKMFDQSISGKILTGTYHHNLKMKNNVNAIADYNGTLRLMYTPSQLGLGLITAECELEDVKKLEEQFEHEVIRKKLFSIWQETWKSKHAEWIKAKMEHETLQHALKEEADQAEKTRQADENARLEKEQLKQQAKLRPPPGRYLEWAKEMYMEQEQKRMARVFLTKKHLDPILLKQQQTPLTAIKEEQRHKKLKQKERLKHSERLFNETVAMLFPNVVHERVIEYNDPYAGGDSPEVKEECMEQFEEAGNQAETFIQENVYDYVLNWHQVLTSSKDRRRNLDLPTDVPSHRNRLMKEKMSSEFEMNEFVRNRLPAITQESLHSDSKEAYAGDNEDNE